MRVSPLEEDPEDGSDADPPRDGAPLASDAPPARWLSPFSRVTTAELNPSIAPSSPHPPNSPDDSLSSAVIDGSKCEAQNETLGSSGAAAAATAAQTGHVRPTPSWTNAARLAMTMLGQRTMSSDQLRFLDAPRSTTLLVHDVQITTVICPCVNLRPTSTTSLHPMHLSVRAAGGGMSSRSSSKGFSVSTYACRNWLSCDWSAAGEAANAKERAQARARSLARSTGSGVNGAAAIAACTCVRPAVVICRPLGIHPSPAGTGSTTGDPSSNLSASAASKNAFRRSQSRATTTVAVFLVQFTGTPRSKGGSKALRAVITLSATPLRYVNLNASLILSLSWPPAPGLKVSNCPDIVRAVATSISQAASNVYQIFFASVSSVVSGSTPSRTKRFRAVLFHTTMLKTRSLRYRFVQMQLPETTDNGRTGYY